MLHEPEATCSSAEPSGVTGLAEVSQATVDAALKARKVKSLLSPVVSIVVALCTGIVLWKGTSLIVAGTMTIGALTVYLAYLTKFFKPVQDLAKMTNTIAQTAVGLERIQTILSADDVIPAEGATGWADSYLLATKAPHPNCAYKWMSYMSEPKPQARSTVS